VGLLICHDPAGGAAHLPRRGQPRLQLEGLVTVHQRVVDLEGDARVVEQGDGVRVHRLRVEGAGHAQGGGVGDLQHGGQWPGDDDGQGECGCADPGAGVFHINVGRKVTTLMTSH